MDEHRELIQRAVEARRKYVFDALSPPVTSLAEMKRLYEEVQAAGNDVLQSLATATERDSNEQGLT